MQILCSGQFWNLAEIYFLSIDRYWKEWRDGINKLLIVLHNIISNLIKKVSYGLELLFYSQFLAEVIGFLIYKIILIDTCRRKRLLKSSGYVLGTCILGPAKNIIKSWNWKKILVCQLCTETALSKFFMNTCFV